MMKVSSNKSFAVWDVAQSCCNQISFTFIYSNSDYKSLYHWSIPLFINCAFCPISDLRCMQKLILKHLWVCVCTMSHILFINEVIHLKINLVTVHDFLPKIGIIKLLQYLICEHTTQIIIFAWEQRWRT